MMKLFGWCLCWLLLTGMTEVWGNDYPRNLRMAFAAKIGDCLSIENHFGTVHIHQIKSDSVMVELTVRALDPEGMVAEGEWGRLDMEKWEGVLRLTTVCDSLFMAGHRLQVDMNVRLPEYVRLDVENRYGNILVGFYNAYMPVCFTAVYGDIRVDSLRSNPDVCPLLNVSNGELKIGKCGDADMRTAYAKVFVGSARNLMIRTEKSTIHIGQSDTITAVGRFTVIEAESYIVFRNRISGDTVESAKVK